MRHGEASDGMVVGLTDLKTESSVLVGKCLVHYDFWFALPSQRPFRLISGRCVHVVRNLPTGMCQRATTCSSLGGVPGKAQNCVALLVCMFCVTCPIGVCLEHLTVIAQVENNITTVRDLGIVKLDFGNWRATVGQRAVFPRMDAKYAMLCSFLLLLQPTTAAATTAYYCCCLLLLFVLWCHLLL